MNPARPQLGCSLPFKDKLRDCDVKFIRDIVASAAQWTEWLAKNVVVHGKVANRRLSSCSDSPVDEETGPVEQSQDKARAKARAKAKARSGQSQGKARARPRGEKE